MTTLITSCTNNADGTYNITFSANITNVNPGVDTPEANILLWSPGLDAWVAVVMNAAAIAATIIVTAAGAPIDCTLIAMAGQPTTITAANPFGLVTPQTTVT